MSPATQRAVVTVRTLPIRLLPGAGEALDSYLELLAQRSGAAWADMLDAVGLAPYHKELEEAEKLAKAADELFGELQ